MTVYCKGLMSDRLLGECPRGAIRIEKREAAEYDERKAMEGIVRHGANTIKAHLKHLKDHGQKACLKQALDYLKEKGIPSPLEDDMKAKKSHEPCGCPGGRTMDLRGGCADEAAPAGPAPSRLRQWPVQLHLASPGAPYFHKADVVVAADCTAYAYGNFHEDFIKGKSLVIACPKLDDGLDIYAEKLQSLIDDAEINTLTVVTMEVPCCGGLLALAKKAAGAAARKVPVKHVVIGIQGGIKSENWV